ncbi:DUF2752 domain-containing protein [Nonomuraea sp. NN258]|uniref:DUF2752 domain-containing protein n=1 Tax=Nonomuraea antri TaxID=2730852 RepID=UPI0015680243|nr:DUF2752 domain-containing protein [Nonomuraea antri]NRQ36197.1 DUF2752 domain-containing protein [Nonomuraea antri]
MTIATRPAAPRARRLLAPLALAAVAGAGFAFVGAVDPNAPGHYPACPFLALTGLYCPGCGTLRAVHALAHLDPVAALGLNPLFVIMLPALVYLWGRWVSHAWRGGPLRIAVTRPAWLWVFMSLVMVYWVVRNLPFGRFLAP